MAGASKALRVTLKDNGTEVRGWEAFVPSDNEEAGKTKAICQICARGSIELNDGSAIIYIKGG